MHYIREMLNLTENDARGSPRTCGAQKNMCGLCLPTCCTLTMKPAPEIAAWQVTQTFYLCDILLEPSRTGVVYTTRNSECNSTLVTTAMHETSQETNRAFPHGVGPGMMHTCSRNGEPSWMLIRFDQTSASAAVCRGVDMCSDAYVHHETCPFPPTAVNINDRFLPCSFPT